MLRRVIKRSKYFELLNSKYNKISQSQYFRFCKSKTQFIINQSVLKNLLFITFHKLIRHMDGGAMFDHQKRI